QAEELAVAERELREREAHGAVHIRETVYGYVDYLSRVAAGEYAARVDVGTLEEDVEGDRELHALGEYLNTTVDALVAALNQAQEVQRRYTEQSWQDIVESGRARPGFAYRQKEITPEVGWLPQMTRAMNSAAPVVEGEGAAVPLVINRQVVGVLGGEHPDGRPWADEELALIEDVTGQLAQTIESLRLFDDVQRRAVQERLVGDVTARIRESLDVETVLKTAAQEMRKALGLDKITVHLEMPQE
ncbi:MAG: GAF domain-containing protein, partial [Anaerolineae bacterium]|nr:GAF domain-containing protein [Anaerolineae bacterium]